MSLRDLGRRLREARRRRLSGEAATAAAPVMAPSPTPSDERDFHLTLASLRAEAGAPDPEDAALEDEIGRRCPSLAACLETLDPEQRRVVLDPRPAILVEAQVGSGKTTVLVARILYLHLWCEIPLEAIAVLTFTNKAADEIAARIARLLPEAGPSRPMAGTFHSVARRLLVRDPEIRSTGRSPDFGVLGEEDRLALLEAIIAGERLTIRYRRRLAARIAAFKAGRPRMGAMKRDDDIARLLSHYESAKRERDLFDYDDLVREARDAIARLPDEECPRAIVIDEFQDADLDLLDFAVRLRRDEMPIFLVGDPQQSIYSFRGGRPDLMEEAARRFGCRRHGLARNYRSTAAILLAARCVLGSRAPLVATREDGVPIRIVDHHDPTQEGLYLAARLGRLLAAGESAGEIAILTRTREQQEVLREVLQQSGLPLANGSRDRIGVALLTFHAAKGLEFRRVFISGANEGIVPLRGSFSDPRLLAEERRLFFVALTRARDGLEISWFKDPRRFGATAEPSPLLAEIPRQLIVHGPEKEPVREEPLPSELKVGARVRHSQYGEGSIIALDEERVKVRFDRRGEKAFVRAFVALEALA